MTSSTGEGRLPVTLIPSHYDLHYHKIDLNKTFTFDGRVAITCQGAAERVAKNRIVLHALELQLHKATLQQVLSEGDSVSYTAHEFRYNLQHQTCEIVFDESLSIADNQTYQLVIDFSGTLNDQMCGLYRSTYKTLDGTLQRMAVTQFEATDARRAFPCWDEPAIKATFALTVTVPSKPDNPQVFLHCLSNTPIASSLTTYQEQTKLLSKTVSFQKTPKMSTYLVALIIGELDAISQTSRPSTESDTTSHPQITTTVYTVPGKAQRGTFCLETASRCLDLYQELYGIAYPLVKSDLIAIPDFAAGAMENWGCVTYREAKVLVDETTSETTRRGIARTVCHELAHQWFGNLVTMEFWTQLWLNEGFARFMEFVAVDKLFPDWNIWTEFVQSVYGLALSLDAMTSSHPVEVQATHPDEITEIFDAISYAKGASIIRMIATHIGMDQFWKGIRIYLSRHAYGNAVTNDVWGALEEASGVPVVAFMEPWTLQVGYPILLLKSDGGIDLTRFLASGPQENDSSKAAWPVPVTVKVEGMDSVQGPFVINGPNGDELETLKSKISEFSSAGLWFKLNTGQNAFYRVSYTQEQWTRLSKVMDPSGPLSMVDRLGLLSDSFAAGKAGYASIVDSLTLVSGFGDHEVAEYAVWQELSENLAGLASTFRSEPWFDSLQLFLKKLYSRQMGLLGWEASPSEPARTGTLRSTVISMMARAGDPDVLKTSFDKFKAFAEDSSAPPLPGDLQVAVMKAALRYDEPAVFGMLKNMYEAGNSLPEEQRNCLSVMGCVKDEKLHATMLEYVLFSGQVRLQDISFPLASLSSTHDAGGFATWAFFKDNYARLHNRFGSGPMWGACVGLSCRGIRSSEGADDVEQFFKDHPPGSAQRRLSQSLEIVRVQIARRERDRDSMEAYLKTQA